MASRRGQPPAGTAHGGKASSMIVSHAGSPKSSGLVGMGSRVHVLFWSLRADAVGHTTKRRAEAAWESFIVGLLERGYDPVRVNGGGLE